MNDNILSVLVVNYNGRPHVFECLSALGEQTLPRHRYEVIVVDNASTDGSADDIARQFPWVRLVRLQTNVGFAEGNNLAIRYAHGRYIVLLNNDAIPDPHWLAELAQHIHPGGILASKLVFHHDPRIINSVGLQLLRDGRGVDVGFRQQDDGAYEAPGEVFAPCGAAMLLDRRMFGERCFDARLFMYCEDLDTAWAGLLRGGRTDYIPRALVRHVHGAAAGDESPLFRFLMERNRTLTCLYNGDLFLAIGAMLGLMARLARALMRYALGRERAGQVRAQAAAVISTLTYLPAAAVERFRRRGEMPCAS